MNDLEAKKILGACSPGSQGASDPIFAEALEEARRRPELLKWLSEQHAFDLRVQATLQKAVIIPPHLKADLLALAKNVQPRTRSWLIGPIGLVSRRWKGRGLSRAASSPPLFGVTVSGPSRRPAIWRHKGKNLSN